MRKGSFLFLVLLVLFDSSTISNNIDKLNSSVCHNSSTLEAFVSSSITLVCECNSASRGRRWKYFDKILYIGANLQDTSFPGSLSIISPYSLSIGSVDFANEGEYACICNFSDTVKYQLFVKGLNIAINGRTTVGDTFYVENVKKVNIACHVNGSNSDGNLSLMKNNQEILSNFSKEREKGLAVEAVMEIDEEKGNISCLWKATNCSTWHEIQVEFFTYAFPKLSLKLNGSRSKENNILFEEKQTLYVECNAERSRPPAKLSLFINDKHNETVTRPFQEQSKLYSTTLTKRIVLEDKQTILTCIANGKYGFVEKQVQVNITTFASAKLHVTVSRHQVENGDTFENDRERLLLFLCDAHGARPAVKLGWTKSGLYEESLQDPELPQNITNKHNSYFHTKSTLELQAVAGKLKVTCFTISDLEIPQQSYSVEVNTRAQNHALTTVVAVFTSVFLAILFLCTVDKLKDMLMKYFSVAKRPTAEIFEEETDDLKSEEIGLTPSKVTLLSILPGEGMIRYWKAVAMCSEMGDEVFVAKTVSETAPLKELYSFRDLAKEVGALEKHSNVVDTIGISIENVPYFIYQEYIEFGSLRDYLMRNYQQRRKSQICSSATEGESHKEKDRQLRLTSFAHGVSAGVSFLASNNLCNPALTSRKVLLTRALNCKLYDFIPQRMAKDKLLLVMQQENAPLAWLPPEIIFLRQYSAKTDVWSFAVLLWEIFSLGDTPYSGMTKDEIEKEIRNGKCLLQPLCCPGGIFGVMLSAWDVDSEKRPTFEKIANEITTVKNSLIQGSESKKDSVITEEPSYFTLHDDGDYDYVTTQSTSVTSL